MYEAALNRLRAFGLADDAFADEAALELECVARDAAMQSSRMSTDSMVLCKELLDALPPAAAGTKATAMFVANMCLMDENRCCAVDVGIPGVCATLMAQHHAMPAETLYYLLDLASTLAAASSRARQALQPSIVGVLDAMRAHAESMEVLLGGCFFISTMVMLEPIICEEVAKHDGIQVLVTAYHTAVAQLNRTSQQQQQPHGRRKASGTSMRHPSATLETQRQEERSQLCTSVRRWAKDALWKMCHAPSTCVDEKLKTTDFGPYGECLEMDEFKWALLFERRKRRSTLAAGSA